MGHLHPAILLTLALAAGSPNAQEKAAPESRAGTAIAVGHVGSLTGPEATFGDSTFKGTKLAIDEQNARGGVNGRRLVLHSLDDQGRPEEAATAAIRLVTREKVLVLLGEVASTRSLAMAPIAESNRVPMISPASTHPGVTKEGDRTRPYVFRVCFIEPFQGRVMAGFARQNQKLSRVAVLKDVGSDYSVGLAHFFAAKFQELGGQVVAEESFKSGDTDFKAQLTVIRGKNPEAIFLPGYYTDVALIARQARELGMKQPFLGGDGWDSAKLYEIARGALDGSYFSNHFFAGDPSPLIQSFVARYRATYGQVPDTLAALGYDSANVAIDAMRRAQELSGPALRQAIENTKGFRGVTGAISFDSDHNPTKTAVILGIEKNAPRYAATVNP